MSCPPADGIVTEQKALAAHNVRGSPATLLEQRVGYPEQVGQLYPLAIHHSSAHTPATGSGHSSSKSIFGRIGGEPMKAGLGIWMGASPQLHVPVGICSVPI